MIPPGEGIICTIPLLFTFKLLGFCTPLHTMPERQCARAYPTSSGVRANSLRQPGQKKINKSEPELWFGVTFVYLPATRTRLPGRRLFLGLPSRDGNKQKQDVNGAIVINKFKKQPI